LENPVEARKNGSLFSTIHTALRKTGEGKSGAIVETKIKFFALIGFERTSFTQGTAFPQLQQECGKLLKIGTGCFWRGE